MVLPLQVKVGLVHRVKSIDLKLTQINQQIITPNDAMFELFAFVVGALPLWPPLCFFEAARFPFVRKTLSLTFCPCAPKVFPPSCYVSKSLVSAKVTQKFAIVMHAHLIYQIEVCSYWLIFSNLLKPNHRTFNIFFIMWV